MRWSTSDKITVGIAAAVLMGLLAGGVADGIKAYRAKPTDNCDARCEIRMIRAILDRIDRRLDAPAPTNSCDIQWPLGRPPKERNL